MSNIGNTRSFREAAEKGSVRELSAPDVLARENMLIRQRGGHDVERHPSLCTHLSDYNPGANQIPQP